MRKIFRISVLSTALSLCSAWVFAQNATTYYVCAGTAFTLSAEAPPVTGATYNAYEWKELAGTPETGTTVGTARELPVAAIVIGNSTFITKKYSLSVFKTAEGCYSDPVIYTVHILPQPVVTLNTIGVQCAEVAANLTLTATVGTLTLPSGVAANKFEWKVNDVVDTGVTTGSFAFTTTNAPSTKYTVSVSYTLPGTIGGQKIDSCVGTTDATITVNPKPVTPLVTLN